MKNITKKTQVILFTFLIVAVILPFSMGDSAEAQAIYTRSQVDKAFYDAGEYATFKQNNKMKVDKTAMLENGMSVDDVKIVKKYAKLHNALIKALISGDENAIEDAKTALHYGAFQYVFNDPEVTSSSTGGVSGQTNVNYFGQAACGITNGVISTYPTTPIIHIGEDGHANENSIRTELASQKLHVVNWPWSDWGDIVYAEKNLMDTTGCDEGEFRDEHHVYSVNVTHTYGNQTTSGWHELIQSNEPNPEVLDYPSPIYWWTGFVSYWHDHY